MKILYISHERKMGGANLALYELATEMKRRGHQVEVVVLHHGCPLDLELKNAGIKTISAVYGWWQRPAGWPGVIKGAFETLHILQGLSSKRLARYACTGKFDIIHSNSSCTDLGAQIATKAGIPHIWHFREYGMADYNLEYSMGRDESVSYINANADKVVFISKALRESYPEIDESKADVIYDGVSESYILSNLNRVTERVSFLISGNLNANKNQMLVLEATNLLLKKGIDNFDVYIAGTSTSLKSSQKYEVALHRFAQQNEISNVHFLGYVKDMNALRAKVNVEIVASVSEAFGRVTAEAMLGHHPVIASDAGANCELVKDGENGLLFQNQNVASLADRMETFLMMPERIAQMGDNAFASATGKYTLSCNADHIEALYEEVCEAANH